MWIKAEQTVIVLCERELRYTGERNIGSNKLNNEGIFELFEYLRIIGCQVYSTCNLARQIDVFYDLATLISGGQLGKL